MLNREYIHDGNSQTPSELRSESEMRKLFHRHLDKEYPSVAIGNTSFPASEVLERMDMVLYVRLFDDWLARMGWRAA